MKRTGLVLRTVVAVVLLLSVLAVSPLQTVFAAETQYISEVKLGYGSTPQEAAQALEKDGYSILTYGDSYKNAKVEEKYQTYADLNQGGGSTFKNNVVVYMGYKTTTDKNEAITDISLMNMKGGYSFTEYDKLMDQYKTSQIKPLVDRLLVTVNEYRTNYNTGEGANKDKAVLMHDVMNMFRDDDTGSGLGDLLLEKTKDEYTDEEYEQVLPDDRSKIADLTAILMQGQTDMTFMIEQLVTLASDTNTNTWLDRFIELGPDGLMEQYTSQGKTPTDANREMAQEFEDTARIISEKWDDFRLTLMTYAEENKDNEILNDEGDEPATPDEEENEEDADQEQASAETSGDQDTGSVNSAEELVDAVKEEMEAAASVTEETVKIRVAIIYNYLKNTKYGDKTLYDFFTQSYDDVSGDNISVLYPMASALSPGQRAGADYLSLFQLIQAGLSDEDSFSQAKENAVNLIKGTKEVSIYSGVNRELYDKGVALTDDLMRADSDSASDVFNGWISGITNKTLAFAAATVVSAIPMVMYWNKALKIKNFVLSPELQRAMKTFESVESIRIQYFEMFTKNKLNNPNWNPQVTVTDVGNGMRVQGGNGLGETFDQVLPYEFKIKTTDDISRVYNKCSASAIDSVNSGIKWRKVMKTGVAVVFSVVFIGLSAYTVWSTYKELKEYYNIEMTPVPKYIVDRKDITTTDNNGKTIVYRNEKAYYEVVRCNRADNAPMAEDSKDYGDLNGDVGKEWLAMYTVKNSALGGPIRADSFRVVVGSTDVPQGYEKAVHMFGQNSAANLTDSRYTYNDSMGGIYVYYQTDKVEQPSGTASVFSQNGVMPALGIGFVIGGAVGVLIGLFINKNKKKKKA